MTVLSINMAKQTQFVGNIFMRKFKPVMEVLDFCESKKCAFYPVEQIIIPDLIQLQQRNETKISLTNSASDLKILTKFRDEQDSLQERWGLLVTSFCNQFRVL